MRDLATLSGLTLEQVASIAMDAKARPPAPTRRPPTAHVEPLHRRVVGALTAFQRAHPAFRVSLGHGTIHEGIDIRTSLCAPPTKPLRGRTVQLTETPLIARGDGVSCARAGMVLGGRRRACAIVCATPRPHDASTFLLFDRRLGHAWNPEELDAIARMKVVALFAEFVGRD